MKKLIRQKGRPELPEDQKRKVRINVFVTETEYERVTRDAEKAKSSVQAYIRERLGLDG